MAITLNPTLAGVQNNISRHPIVNINSEAQSSSAPFDGVQYSPNEDDPLSANTVGLIHSSGRFIAISRVFQDDDNPHRFIRFTYTDTDKINTTTKIIDIRTYNSYTSTSSGDPDYYNLSFSICELSDGNLGVVLSSKPRQDNGYLYVLNAYIFTPTGESVLIHSPGGGPDYNNIFTAPVSGSPTDYEIKKVKVITLADGSYAVVYSYNILHYTGDPITSIQIIVQTSSDFITWSSQIDISPTGFDANKIEGVSIVQQADETFVIVFDYIESDSIISDVYYMSSSSLSSGYSAPTNLTNNTAGSDSKNTDIIQKANGDLLIAFDNQFGTRYMDDDTDINFPDCPAGSGGGFHDGHYNQATGKLYIVAMDTLKQLQNVIEIDVPTWSVTNHWNESTTPAINSIFFNTYSWWDNKQGAGKWIPLLSKSKFAAVINTESDTIKQYNFVDNGTYGLTTNVNHSITEIENLTLQYVSVDLPNDKLYFYFTRSYVYDVRVEIGWIDLNESGPTYTYNSIISETLQQTEGEIIKAPDGGFVVDSVNDLIYAWTGYLTGYSNGLRIWTISTPALYKYYYSSIGSPRFTENTWPNFPNKAIKDCVYYNGSLWATFAYDDDDVQQENFRGILQIDLTTDIMIYHRPTYASVDDYDFSTIGLYADNKLLITCPVDGGGVVLFDPATLTWEKINNANYPNFFVDNFTSNNDDNILWYYGYDTNSKTAFTSRYFSGIYAFIPGQYYKQIDYVEGTLGSFSDPTSLLIGLNNSKIELIIDDATDDIYMFWDVIDSSSGLPVVYFNTEANSSVNLNQFLVLGEEITISRSIDGSLQELEFTVAHGNLFDPFNLISIMRSVLAKGRIIIIQFGDKINDTDYLQDLGTFYIDDVRLNYGVGKKHPTATVRAVDSRVFWEHSHIVATEYYTVAPEIALQNLIINYSTMVAGDLDLPTIPNGFEINHQFIDTDLKTIADDIANRFGYFIKIGVDGILTLETIDESKTVSNIYSDETRITEFTPEDSYSNYTNRVIVTGEEDNYIEVTFDEERLASLNGTVGWYGFHKDFTIYYSEDKNTRARFPRLHIVETSASIGFQIAGGINESMRYIDPDERYCIIEIDAPDLTGLLIASIIGYIAATYIPDSFGGVGSGMTIPVGRIVEGVALNICMMVLGSIGNYQYEIWGRPIGEIRREIQGKADDVNHQSEIGRIITERIEGFLCYTVANCEQVAAFELMVVRLQRKRVKLSKISNYQDEEGDVIQVVHPYTKQSLKLLITDLTRRMKIPDFSSNDGYVIDDIEGWVV